MIRLASIALVGMTLTLGGCLQGVGDRCQVTGDCQDNLVCVIPPGGTAVSGGLCQKQATTDGGGGQDLQVAPDLQTAGDMTAVAHDDLATVD